MPICRTIERGLKCIEEAVESSRLPGRYFHCRTHQERLDRVSDALRDDAARKSHKNKTKVKDRFCAGGCGNRPIYGSDYCEDCNEDIPLVA